MGMSMEDPVTYAGVFDLVAIVATLIGLHLLFFAAFMGKVNGQLRILNLKFEDLAGKVKGEKTAKADEKTAAEKKESATIPRHYLGNSLLRQERGGFLPVGEGALGITRKTEEGKLKAYSPNKDPNRIAEGLVEETRF